MVLVPKLSSPLHFISFILHEWMSRNICLLENAYSLDGFFDTWMTYRLQNKYRCVLLDELAWKSCAPSNVGELFRLLPKFRSVFRNLRAFC